MRRQLSGLSNGGIYNKNDRWSEISTQTNSSEYVNFLHIDYLERQCN